MLAAAVNDHLFWITSRAAGTLALLFSSVGIVAGWSLALLGLSYYARQRIGPQRWRKLHRFTALAWVLGLAHSLGEGTDAGTAWFLVATGIVAIPAAALLVTRVSRGTAVAR